MTEDYYSIKAISASQVKDFADDPITFWERSPFNPAKQKETDNDAMIFGKLCHCLLLEGEDKFKEEFTVAEFGKSRKNKEYDKVKLLYPNINVVNSDELAKANKMVEAVKAHPLASKLLAGAISEHPLLFKDKETGLDCKSKFDSI